MATNITGSTILLPVITKVENQDVHGKNWATEIVKLDINSANDSATYTLNTSTTTWPAATSATGPLHITTPMFVTVDAMDATATGWKATYGAGSVVITWTVAPTDVIMKLKIEGWA